MADGPHHPAKFSEPIIELLVQLVDDGVIHGRVLDPFAGTGRIHLLGAERPGVSTWGVELEPEWAGMHPRTLPANALDLPFRDHRFDTVATSPAYGNRFADGYDGRDGSRRQTYRLSLGRPLSKDSGAALQWGPEYRNMHRLALAEMRRVLRPAGRLVLNMSNHIRDDVEQDVVGWWRDTMIEFGFSIDAELEVVTARMKDGANAEARVEAEKVLVATAPAGDAPAVELARQVGLF